MLLSEHIIIALRHQRSAKRPCARGVDFAEALAHFDIAFGRELLRAVEAVGSGAVGVDVAALRALSERHTVLARVEVLGAQQIDRVRRLFELLLSMLSSLRLQMNANYVGTQPASNWLHGIWR